MSTYHAYNGERYDAEDVTRAMAGRWEEFYSLYTLLKPSGGQLAGRCPIHRGDGPNFKVDPETGRWFCHSQCGLGGDVYGFLDRYHHLPFAEAVLSLARWAGLPVPEPLTMDAYKAPAPKPWRPPLRAPGQAEMTPDGTANRAGDGRPSPSVLAPQDAARCHAALLADAEILAWLRAHRGLTRETLERFGVGLTLQTMGDRERDLPWPRITFPVHDRWGRLTNIRKHLFAFDPGVDRAKLGKTLPWAAGLPADLFPLSALWGEGRPGAGTPPVSQVRHPPLLGEGHGEDREGRGSEGTGEETAARAISESPSLTGEGLGGVAATGGPSGGPTLTGRGGELVSRGGSRPLHDRTVDLADVPPPPADLPYLWGPYFNEGASHWLTGKTGLGKSTFAFNLACALAEGRTLWGVPCTARRLLYVDLESGDIGRSLKVQRLYGDRPRQAGRLRFVREPLRLPDESAELVAYAEQEKFDLVIFDTARRVFAVRDENDNAEVYLRVIPTLDALKARGVATLTMGHPPKNGGLGARGAGAQEDAGDVNLLLTMHRGEVTDPDGVLSLSITKNRLLGLGTPPLYLKRVGHDQFERVDARDLPPAEDADAPEKQSPRDRCRAAVLALLGSNRGEPVAYKDVVNALAAQGMSQSTINRALKELMDEGEVVQPTSGQYVLADPFA